MLLFFTEEPGPPDIVSVTDSGDREVAVHWTNPTEWNGPLDSVSAIARKDGVVERSRCSVDMVDTICTIRNLQYYTNYSISVVGYNTPWNEIGGG